jgi:probable HAF family extracellular repeat protein
MFAAGINKRGQIVGVAPTPFGNSHAFIWTQGLWADLGALPGQINFSEATSVNDGGNVVGYSISRSSTAHAVLWSDSTLTDLGALSPQSSSVARGINDQDEIVGEKYGVGIESFRAVLWTRSRRERAGGF